MSYAYWSRSRVRLWPISKQNALFSINYRAFKLNLCVLVLTKSEREMNSKIFLCTKMPLNFRRILINFLQCKIIENILARCCFWQGRAWIYEKVEISMKILCNYLLVPFRRWARRERGSAHTLHPTFRSNFRSSKAEPNSSSRDYSIYSFLSQAPYIHSTSQQSSYAENWKAL